MKYPLLTALLAVATINVKGGLFGGKPFASFTEEQLEKIEKALEKQDTTALTQQLEALQNEVSEKDAAFATLETAVTQALALNDLTPSETVAESISLLGTTCKEYGEKKSVHTPLTHNGKEVEIEDTLQDGYFDPNAAHNQID